jgi:hypothetical protein
MNLSRALRTTVVSIVAALALGHVGTAQAAGGSCRFDGGTTYQHFDP